MRFLIVSHLILHLFIGMTLVFGHQTAHTDNMHDSKLDGKHSASSLHVKHKRGTQGGVGDESTVSTIVVDIVSVPSMVDGHTERTAYTTAEGTLNLLTNTVVTAKNPGQRQHNEDDIEQENNDNDSDSDHRGAVPNGMAGVLTTTTTPTTTTTLPTAMTTRIATRMTTTFVRRDGPVGFTVAVTEPTIVGVSNSSSQKFMQLLGAAKTMTATLKTQKTDAPMLNYIFDSLSSVNKHHHHDHRYGPHFEDIPRTGNATNITVQIGSTIFLNCRISLLQDKTVSWVRRKEGEDDLQLITVGMQTYSGDPRYTIEFQYPHNWRLKIANTKKIDEGTYECQISTHPPRIIQINLHINAPEVMIIDEHGGALHDKYYEVDSTIRLSCIVRHVAMTASAVLWSHGDQILNYDTSRGGISVKTDLMEAGANSTLFLARVNKSDSGNYTCSISRKQFYAVAVHVLNGESYAELHHGGGIGRRQRSPQHLIAFVQLLVWTIFAARKHLPIR